MIKHFALFFVVVLRFLYIISLAVEEKGTKLVWACWWMVS